MASAHSTLTVGPAVLATPPPSPAPDLEPEVEAMAGSGWLAFEMAACDWLLLSEGAPLDCCCSEAPAGVASLSQEASVTQGKVSNS